MRSPKQRLAVFSVLVGIAIGFTGCGGHKSGPVPARTPTPDAVAAAAPLADVLHLVAAAPAIKTLPSGLTPDLADVSKDLGVDESRTGRCFLGIEQTESPACVFGDPTGSRTVVLLGDSHAFMWMPAFDTLGKRLHWKVVLLSKAACPPGDMSLYNTTARAPYPQCDRWHDYAVARINQMNPDLVVLTTATVGLEDGDGKPVSGDVWSAALQKTLNLLTSSKTKRVVLGDIPRLGIGPNAFISGPECLAAHEHDVQTCSTPTQVAVSQTLNQAEQTAAAQAAAQYVDVIPWFCSSACTAVIGNMVVYWDSAHITRTYATYLSGALQSALQPIVDAG
mgnify:CR=1 FL=1